MGIVYQGTNYANTQLTPVELIEQGQQRGTVQVMRDSFKLTADLAAGDTIIMGGYIPEGAILVNCIISSDALGGSCTINVGWSVPSEQFPTGGGGDTLMTANATGFFSALPVSSAVAATARGSSYEGGGIGPTASTFEGLKLTSPIQVVIAENAASSGATGKVIAIEVNYIIE